MKYIKLFFISLFVFGFVFFFISLLFPQKTYISRAKNIAKSPNPPAVQLPVYFKNATANTPLYRYQSLTPSADTLLFSIAYIQGGLCIYPLSNDSVTLQMFYKIYTPWYKPWLKFGLMLNEEKYGPSLDSALVRIQ